MERNVSAVFKENIVAKTDDTNYEKITWKGNKMESKEAIINLSALTCKT